LAPEGGPGNCGRARVATPSASVRAAVTYVAARGEYIARVVLVRMPWDRAGAETL